MKTNVVVFFVLCAMTARSQRISHADTYLQEVRQIHNELVKNWLAHDTIGQSQFLHNDFIYLCPNGQIADRREYLKLFHKEYDPARAKDLTVTVDHIRVFDNLALVTAHIDYKVEAPDHALIPRQTPFTDFYLRTDGGWKLIQVQVTPPGENFISLK